MARSNLLPPEQLDDGLTLEYTMMRGGTYEVLLFCPEQAYHRLKVVNWRSDAPTTYTAVSLCANISDAVREYQRRCGNGASLRLVR